MNYSELLQLAKGWGNFISDRNIIWRLLNIKDKELFIGSVTAPYNSQEEIYGRTRALLEQLKGSGAKLSIATKSDLILRDLELIKTFPNARVSCSINTLDENFRENMETSVSI